MKRLTFFGLALTLVYLSCCNAAPAAQATWKAGVAKANITPREPYCLAGFGGEKRIAKEKRHDLWIKVLALEDAQGHRGLVIGCDICGFDRVSYDAICQGLKERCGLNPSQIILNFTHNHVGPVTRNSLMTFHAFTPEDLKQIDAYTKDIERKTVDAAVEAFGRMTPATLSLGLGETNFAMNRRNNAAEQVSNILCQGGELKGPVDHNLPVLAVRSPQNELMAVVFAYSCHPVTTVESYFSGDFPGFAMVELEKDHPGAMALFCQACGADQNPVFRGTIDTAHDYGRRLAAAVEDVLAKPMTAIEPVLDTVDASITLDYEKVVGRQELEAAVRRASEDVPAEQRNIVDRKARWAKELLVELDAKGKLPTGYPYPLLAWRLGGKFLWIGLGGEPMADYALTLRGKYGPNTIVTGYCGDLIGYIPSERVWKEGWGEEVEYLWEYSRPANRWTGDTEQRILAAVDQLIQKLRGTAVAKPVSKNTR
jgi:neutral ceramidase